MIKRSKRVLLNSDELELISILIREHAKPIPYRLLGKLESGQRNQGNQINSSHSSHSYPAYSYSPDHWPEEVNKVKIDSALPDSDFNQYVQEFRTYKGTPGFPDSPNDPLIPEFRITLGIKIFSRMPKMDSSHEI